MLGGNLIDYPGNVSTRTAELETIKILVNSTISTPGTVFITADVENFYLETPLDWLEYVKIPVPLIPTEIMVEYALADLIHNGYVYCIIEKGMYGLPQSGILANNLLNKRLEPHGYYECIHTPGLWRHKTQEITFTLVVDDFGIKQTSKADSDDLIAALRQHYGLKVDRTGSLYCRVTMKWDYGQRIVDLSMPGYVRAALEEFKHPNPKKAEHQPHRHSLLQYGVKLQLTDPLDLSEPLDAEGVLRVQKSTGKFQYYSCAVDPTMNVALSTLASQQSKATQQTAKDTVKFLNYCATHTTATIRYYASNMILKLHSDASYNSEPKACSRSGGHFYMGNNNNADDTTNRAILATTGVMKAVLSSASEAEIGALFENCKKAAVLRTTLAEMGHLQLATPIQTDNSTACGIANDTIKQQRSQAIDMRFYWVRDPVQQGQFQIYWGPGKLNLANYYTKHHAATHHQVM
jgi:hypothetical protein